MFVGRVYAKKNRRALKCYLAVQAMPDANRVTVVSMRSCQEIPKEQYAQ